MIAGLLKFAAGHWAANKLSAKKYRIQLTYKNPDQEEETLFTFSKSLEEAFGYAILNRKHTKESFQRIKVYQKTYKGWRLALEAAPEKETSNEAET